MILVSPAICVASQLQAAGTSLAETFDLRPPVAVPIGSALVRP